MPDNYTIKAGNLLPGIAGRVSAPAEIDLLAAPMTMTFRARRSGTLRTVTIVNDGLVAGQAEDAEDLEWAWHYSWQAGDTDEADYYDLGITAVVEGVIVTFPNAGWAQFVIEPQL